MTRRCRNCGRGFTLIEVLTALLVLSLLALMSYRGLGAVLDAREHVRAETDKWRAVAAFFARFERDVELASPRPVRFGTGVAPAWSGGLVSESEARLEFSRFASADGVDTARRIGYRLNEKQEIELWVWPGLDVAPDTVPARYAVLAGVKVFELKYMNSARTWIDTWPVSLGDSPMPRAVRVRLVLASDEEIIRIFALRS